MLPPGVPAMFVLLGVACAGSKFSRTFIKASPQYANLAELSVTLTGVATIFWFWAAYKLLVLEDADYGVVSFLVALAANYRTADLCAVEMSRPGHRSTSLLAAQRWLQPVGCFLVAVNYLWVLFTIKVLPDSFQLYLAVGASYWVGAAWRTYLLHVRSTDANSPRPEVCNDRTLERQKLYGGDTDEVQEA